MNVLVVASEAEHPGRARAWGTGGWTPPEAREARDWLTLCRLLGWQAQLATSALDRVPADVQCVLIACPPDGVGEPLAGALRDHLECAPALVVARAARAGAPLAAVAQCARLDGAVSRGTLGTAALQHDIRAARLDGRGEPLLTVGGAPAALARTVGQGTFVTLAVHPSAARDAGGGAALRTLLTRAFPGPVAWLDTEGMLVLRMDDPGGAQNVHLDPWAYTELGPSTWREVAGLLSRHAARLSVAAVPAWVDDGDPARGELTVDGRPAERVAGRLHPSWSVRYRDRRGRLNDYAGEFAVLRELRAAGLLDVQLHGHTHMQLDLERWSRAPDRHDSIRWYREVDPSGADHSLALGLEQLSGFFGARPTTVVFPGDEWTNASLERALELDLKLAASYYLAIRDSDRFCWCEQVCAPYLDDPDPRWFASGLPVVGYFHARDIATNGVAWLGDLLGRWSDAGAMRMVGFDDLAFALGCRLGYAGGELTVSPPAGLPPRPLSVLASDGAGAEPVRLSASPRRRAGSPGTSGAG